MNKVILGVTPPFIKSIIKKVVGKNNRFIGNYSSWKAALRDCNSYQSQDILENVKRSTERVLRGEIVYERDGVCFESIQYASDLNAAILLAYLDKDANELFSTLDFGGAFGTTYRQFESFTNSQLDFIWRVLEQKNFSETGKLFFETSKLKFYDSENYDYSSHRPNITIISSVLEFIEHPYEMLKKLSISNSKYFVLDRTPVWSGESDVLTVLKAARHIGGSYPCWIFARERIKSFFAEFELIAEWPALDGKFEFSAGEAEYIGMLWKQK